jgi:glycosyltransferase involved in cell wall biosynthesis
VVPSVTGLVAHANADFVAAVLELARDRERLRRLGAAAREKVAGSSWDAAFAMTYKAYRYCVSDEAATAQAKKVSVAKRQQTSLLY